YSIEDGGDELTVTRFTAAVYHCDINAAGKQLVAGGGDFVVKIVNLDDYSQVSLTGHEAPILCTAFDPLNEFVASSSCDGTVRVWNIADKKCVQSWDNHTKSNEMANSKTLCHICWDKSGENLYVPSVDKVCAYRRNSWESIRCYSFEGFENISVCCVCPNDEYIAATNDKGIVIIWKLKEESNQPSAIFVHPKEMPITSFRWHPTKNHDFSFCDQNGELYCVTVKQSEALSETLMENICQGLFDDDDDFAEEVEETKAAEPPVTQPKDSEKDNVVTNNFDDMFEDNDNEIDIGAIKSKYEPKIFGNDAADDDNETEEKKSIVPADGILDDISVKSEKITKPAFPPVNLQQPFQPGSTPISFQHRFMVWNSVGIVTSFSGEDENTIDIEFHDTTIHHSIHFTNTYNYVIADLSTEALLCANTGDEMTTSSRLFCMHFGTWDSNKEWKYDMADDEYVTALTLGTGFAAVATDQRFIRLFTVTGIQLHILSVTGPVVCLAAQEQLLSIFYHNSIGVPREQCISAKVMKVDPTSTFIKQEYCSPVSLSPKSTIYWAGFTDEGTLCTVDSVGVIRLYKQLLGNSWTPILDTRRNGKSKSDHYFVVGLSEIQQQVRYLLSRGSLYPSTLPRPTLLLLDFQIPLCEMTTARSINEVCFFLFHINFDNQFTGTIHSTKNVEFSSGTIIETRI
ncbi:WD repeat and HMG-box DNA-binding protein 1-like protein, partial [Leptotrombidium deliense]